MLEFEPGHDLSDLGRWLAEAEERILEAADAAIVEAASDAADLVEANAPELTGRLRGSVRHDHRGWALAVIEVGEGVPYTRAQESRTAFFNRSVNVIWDG